jgi:hypothetical protein
VTLLDCANWMVAMMAAAIVNAKTRSGQALAIEPGVSQSSGIDARQCRDSGLKACGLAPE